MPVTKLKFSELSQLVCAYEYVKVLSVVPCSVMPPPSASVSVTTPVGDLFNSIFLSSTCKVVVLIVKLSPSIVKFPETFKSPLMSTVLVGALLKNPILWFIESTYIAVFTPPTGCFVLISIADQPFS